MIFFLNVVFLRQIYKVNYLHFQIIQPDYVPKEKKTNTAILIKKYQYLWNILEHRKKGFALNSILEGISIFCIMNVTSKMVVGQGQP